MPHSTDRRIQRIAQRKAHVAQNLFARMPSAYAASRLQGQRILRDSAGLSIVEWRVLWDLAEAGPMTIREMAQIQRIDHSQLSRALPSMREKGFVAMSQDNADGRQVVVSMSSAGRQAYEKASPVMQRRRDALRAEFSEAELEQIIEMLVRFEEFCRSSVEDIVGVEPVE